jgi:ribosomal protein L20A (L18A)
MQYEVEFESTTYRTISVDAESKEDAIEKAYDELGNDFDVSREWFENAEIVRAKEER